MELIVQKFGGTSVGNDENRQNVAQKIKAELSLGNKVVVIVSAMGRKPQPYSTDALLSLTYNDAATTRDVDLLMSCGEVISSVVMASLLNSMGIKSQAINGLQAGIKTTGDFSKAKCVDINPAYILDLLQNDIVPIIAGFQGIYNDVETTTLGRGGSDTTAALIAGAINADRIDIYTDVDGIMSADPRVVEKAQIIDVVNSEEVFQMAVTGAKVIHPRAVEAAKASNINMHIKNTYNNEKGTKITPQANEVNNDNAKMIIAITGLSNRTQIKIVNLKENTEATILNTLADNKISIDLINIFADYMVFTIDSSDDELAEKLLDDLNIEYIITTNLSKVNVIGSKMHGIPGVTAKIISALLDIECPILQTADSYTNISCLVPASFENKAVNTLHEAFELSK